MNPSFLTSEYVAACAEAKYVQAWWRATWEPGKHAGSGLVWVDPHFVALEGSRPIWGLPHVGTGVQTNVRTGDFFRPRDWAFGSGSPRVALITHRSLQSGVAFASNIGGFDVHPVPDGLSKFIFLPRLDQLLWFLSVKRCSLEQVATMYALMGAPTHPWERVNSWPLDLLPQADDHLRDIGVPL